jgi:hypothetical protein
MNCPSCGQELPKELDTTRANIEQHNGEYRKWNEGGCCQDAIVEKVQRRMEEYATWTWEKMFNPELPRLPWDVKNRGFSTYGDRKK